MNFVKAFMAGVTLPAFLMPLILFFIGSSGHQDISKYASFHFIPFVWGVWNGLYFTFYKGFLPEGRNLRLFITGAVLGLLVAAYIAGYLMVPEAFGLEGIWMIAPFIVAPVVYGVVWVYVVGWFNSLVGLQDG